MGGDGARVPERRVFRRTDLRYEVEIDALAPESRGVVEETIAGELFNVGCGGVLTRVERILPVDTPCRVRFPPLEPGSDPYEARGTVRRKHESARGNFLGIQFDERLDALRIPPDREPAADAGTMIPSKVLVVDDEPTIRDLLGRFLTRRGCEVDTAEDGEAALAAMREDQPDMVLLDIRMPKLSGLQVLEKIRSEELRPGAIWAISGYASDDEAREALRLGASDFINKPLDLQYLDWSLRLHQMGV